MNKTAEQLKKRLEEIFDATTERSSLLAETAMDVPIDDKTQKAFDFLEKETLEIISTNLKNGDTFCWPDDDYFLHLRTMLSFKPYFIYPSWHARDDITEDELLALKNEIIAEDLPKLEPLRSPTRRQDFAMPMLNTYWKFKTHLSNTRYMIVVLVHIANTSMPLPRQNPFSASPRFSTGNVSRTSSLIDNPGKRHYLKALELATDASGTQREAGRSFLSSKEQAFLDYLVRHHIHTFTPVEMAKPMHVTNRTIINWCAKLVGNGMLLPKVDGKRIRCYQVTELA